MKREVDQQDQRRHRQNIFVEASRDEAVGWSKVASGQEVLRVCAHTYETTGSQELATLMLNKEKYAMLPQFGREQEWTKINFRHEGVKNN
jgi:hypothetical protein